MDFTERLELYREGGMITDKDVEDVNAIVAMFQRKYGITLCEENADTFIAHLCAAFGRNTTGEAVVPLPDEVFAEVEELESYPLSRKMLEDLMAVSQNTLNEAEQRYALMHINNLIANLGYTG